MRTIFLVLASAVLSTMLLFTGCENKEYKVAIEKGDELYKAKKYAPAKTSYANALKILPDEEYPKQQIEKLDQILAKLAKQKAIADEKKFKALVADADKMFENEDWANSKSMYQKALKIKPKEDHPKNRITEINQILKEIEDMKNNPYHTILGCFEVNKNAINFHAKVKSENSKYARIFSFGRFDAVTYKSYPTLSAAYNELSEAQKISPNAWVTKK